MDYLVPVQNGKDWNRDRTLGLPVGTLYTIAEHDEGEWAESLNEGVRRSKSDMVFLGASDAWVQTDPSTLKFLEDQLWNADMAYGPLIHHADGQPTWVQGQAHFCANRLYRENYIPGVAAVRKSAFLEAGGVTSGMWDLWLRMHEQGSHIKYVAEAVSARDDQPLDLSPSPEPKETLATFYYQATAGTTYWRCLLPARYLPGQAIFNFPVQAMDDNGSLVFPQHQGTAVLQFTGDESHYLLVKRFKETGVRVLIEMDDNYSSWFPDHMKKAGWKRDIQATLQEIPRDPANPEAGTVTIPMGYNVETHLATVALADGVICTTPYLAAQYRKHNENVYVCGNHIDPQDWPDVEKPDDGKFRVGWFASGSHRNDAQLIGRACEWAAKQEDVEVVMVNVGVTRNQPWWPFQFKYVPWTPDFAVYRKVIQELDVGLAPVVGTPWALCRSDLKALEYAMGDTLPVVSDVPPYADTEMPHLQRCKTPKDFLRAVQWAYSNQDEVREQGRECRKWTLQNRTMERNIDQWKVALAA